MNFKPSEFFIGLVDFIAILLPGAVLTTTLLVVEYHHPLQTEHYLYLYSQYENQSVIFWVAFVFFSFGLGYFLSSLASGLDMIYDGIRKQIYPYEEDLKESFDKLDEDERKRYVQVHDAYVARAKKKKKKINRIENESEDQKPFSGFKIAFASNILRRALAWNFKFKFEVRVDDSYEETRKLLDKQPEAVGKSNNVFKWAITVLEANYPSINEQATRIMAASKFFRSMVVVILIILGLQAFQLIPRDLWILVSVVMLLCFREYIVQRHKSVSKTYQSVVTLTYFTKEPVPPSTKEVLIRIQDSVDDGGS